MMKNLKDLFDAYFLQSHNVSQGKIKPIKAEYTESEKFDLNDDENFLVNYGDGTASFRNNLCHQIEVLAYNELLKQYNDGRYKSLSGTKCCDFILYDKESPAIIFNELTTSSSGMVNLQSPKDSKTNLSKFEKVEIQLSDSVAKMREVDEINDFLNSCTTKVCLCSYKLYTGENSAQKAFNRVYKTIDKETGEDGAILSSHIIKEQGFEFRRISHNYSFQIS